MKRSLIAAAAAWVLTAPLLAQAATVNSSYTQILGNKWAVNFTVLNDGAPAVLTGMTVYFPQLSFSSLLVYNAPAGWDSLVIQPDAALPANGFFDTFSLDAAHALTSGQSQSGFEIRFTYLGTGRPGALAFDINDSAYNVLYSGVTTVVPEPSSTALIVCGLLAIGAYRGQRTFGDHSKHNTLEKTA